MAMYELAKQIVCKIIAVALSMTVAAVEGLLPHRPDWLERVENLAIQLRALAAKSAEAAAAAEEEEAEESPAPGLAEAAAPAPEAESLAVDTERLMLAYDKLWHFVHDLRSDGLSLDDSFCARVEREWSVATLINFMRNADRSLQEHAAAALEAASAYLVSTAGGQGPSGGGEVPDPR